MLNNLIPIFVGLLLINCSSAEKVAHNSMYDSFGVVYSEIEPKQTEGYNFLIVEPYFYTKQEISNFHSRGLKVVAYISLGEVNESRRYFEEFKEILCAMSAHLYPDPWTPAHKKLKLLLENAFAIAKKDIL